MSQSSFIRPSTTTSTLALWLKSALNAVWFFALFLALLPWLAHRALPLSLPFAGSAGRVLGVAVFVSGLVLWVWCLDIFSRQGRGTPFPLDAPSQLATHGPYAVVRNPIMVAELGIAWAEALYFASLGVLLYAVVVSILGHLAVVRVEEPELRQRIGAAYDDYCARVPRWLPGRRGPGTGLRR